MECDQKKLHLFTLTRRSWPVVGTRYGFLKKPRQPTFNDQAVCVFFCAKNFSPNTNTPKTINKNAMSKTTRQEAIEAAEAEYCDKDESGNLIRPLQIDGLLRKDWMEILVSTDPKYNYELQIDKLIGLESIVHVYKRIVENQEDIERYGVEEVQMDADSLREMGAPIIKRQQLFHKKYLEVYGGQRATNGNKRVQSPNGLVATKGERKKSNKKPKTDALLLFQNRNHQAMPARTWKTWLDKHNMNPTTPLQFWVNFSKQNGVESKDIVYKRANSCNQRITWRQLDENDYPAAKKEYMAAAALLQPAAALLQHGSAIATTAVGDDCRDSDDDFLAN